MVQFTLLTLVWCSGLWDPFSMFTKIKIIQLSIFSSWDSLALVHFLWRTCERTHFHWFSPPYTLYYICGVLVHCTWGLKSVGKCVWGWKQVKMKQKGLPSLIFFLHGPAVSNIALITCLSPCLSACLPPFSHSLPLWHALTLEILIYSLCLVGAWCDSGG